MDRTRVGSRLELEQLTTRRLDESVALAHAKAMLHVPAGPLAGESRATQTFVLAKAGGLWQIRAFHNTLVRDMPGIPRG